ncbi:NUDIX hydrolase [Chloroflexota bacterium]
MLTKFEIQERLNQVYSPGLIPESPYPLNFLDSHQHPAAVLIPLWELEGNWHLLFIRRTEYPNDRHSGQVAFPGGRCEPTDLTAENAALREAQEEVGINPTDVQILGRLRDILTISHFRVTPIVGMMPWPYNFSPQEYEVARIFSIPLNWLANPGNRKIQMRGLKILGRDVPVIYFEKYEGELLWGASARITLLLMEALGFAKPGCRYSC